MHAVIETGGKQYKVAAGDTIYIEKLPQNAGDTITFDRVIAVFENEKVKLGTPYVSGVTVEGKIVKNGKGKKVMIFKYKPKKNYRRRQGHRQPYTKVTIEKVAAL